MLRLGEAANAVSISRNAAVELFGCTESTCVALAQYGKSLPVSASCAAAAESTAAARRTVTCTSVNSDVERLSTRNSARSFSPSFTDSVAESPEAASFKEVSDSETLSSASSSCGNPHRSELSGDTGTGSGAARAAGAAARADKATNADEAANRFIAG